MNTFLAFIGLANYGKDSLIEKFFCGEKKTNNQTMERTP